MTITLRNTLLLGEFKKIKEILMVYTVKKLSEISKVSIRTLHFYDDIGLLKPSYIGSNGYRYYEEKQLLLLQQILFFKELGFELKEIHKIVSRKDFDKLLALTSHRNVLKNELLRIKKIIATIDKTVKHLKGVKKMKDDEMYLGFNKEKQREYEKYLVNRFGEKVNNDIHESNQKMKKWTKEELKENQKEFSDICSELVLLLNNNFKAESKEVQNIILRHYEWLKKYWTPSRESYIGLGKCYIEYEWKTAFKVDPEHPRLAKFLADGMKIFAEKNL